ncbi:Bug family tripartite tricarboxylate transporter substrate binding protein [Leucobacter sp. M11]|uniref:Bug family tripartite tricarboxylate transporter substrate binding protein n=1 Tax=Leucobacter sp. M11 TaxID=2993565 RepID=UPI002D7FECF4|nr:tripartite tricarboxylate transporter substrate binding protein [Leucobacter sp. M11]MEB4615533.1 tripartite tricarboxylate transporter substrate binding protein [Leucobacter sp. M11]
MRIPSRFRAPAGGARLATGVLAAAAVLSLAACSAGPTAEAPAGSAEPLAQVQVIAPADPGGGWDQTARAIVQVGVAEGLVKKAPVTNISGAGGTVGLASLATENDPATLMVTGLVMVGAVETNATDVRLEDTTPIARLTEEALVVVVPKDSPYTTLQELVDAIVQDGPKIAVTGGSAGGADHILAAQLLTESGVPAEKIPGTLNYIANSGGGEAVTMLLGGTVQAGISGVGEFAEQVEAGGLRALAVSSAEPVAALPEVPTIQDEGIDLTLTNWRGLIAPGGLDEAETATLVDFAEQLQASAGWQAELKTRGWDDAYLSGADFEEFLTENIAEVTETLGAIGLTE